MRSMVEGRERSELGRDQRRLRAAPPPPFGRSPSPVNAGEEKQEPL